MLHYERREFFSKSCGGGSKIKQWKNDLERQSHLRNSSELGAGILAGNRLLGVKGVAEGSSQLIGASSKVHLVVLGVLEEGGGPRMTVEGLSRDENSSGGNLRRSELQHAILLEGALGEEAGQLDHGAVSVCCLEVAAEEGVDGGHSQLVIQSSQDISLHLKDISLGIGLVGDEDQLAEFRGVDLLVLRSNLV